MEMPFGLYPRFYVRRKDQLFPLIEKYSGKKISEAKTHGEIIRIYYNLLRTDPAFKADVDALIDAQGDKLATKREKVILKNAEKEMKKDQLQAAQNKKGYMNALGIVAGLTSIFGTIQETKQTEAENDQMFMQAVLGEQQTSDTTKILIVTGVTVAFVALGVFLVLKMKK